MGEGKWPMSACLLAVDGPCPNPAWCTLHPCSERGQKISAAVWDDVARHERFLQEQCNRLHLIIEKMDKQDTGQAEIDGGNVGYWYERALRSEWQHRALIAKLSKEVLIIDDLISWRKVWAGFKGIWKGKAARLESKDGERTDENTRRRRPHS